MTARIGDARACTLSALSRWRAADCEDDGLGEEFDTSDVLIGQRADWRCALLRRCHTQGREQSGFKKKWKIRQTWTKDCDERALLAAGTSSPAIRTRADVGHATTVTINLVSPLEAWTKVV